LEEEKGRSYLVCPECKYPLVLLTSKKAKYSRSGEPRKYWRCANMKQCSVVCGAHPDGTPMGIPGDRETRQARDHLHQVFDPLWISKRWTRIEAYWILEILTGLNEDEAHIARFDQEQCKQVEEQIRDFLELNPQPESHGVPIPWRYRFINVRRKCTQHGFSIHRVYIRGREQFCQECLNQRSGRVWWTFLVFIKKGIYS